MTDIHDFLKNSGYLDGPAQRMFWQGATPTLRGHLRQLAILSLLSSLPISALLASLSQLGGSDRLMLFLFYIAAVVIGLVGLDLVIAAAMRLRPLEHFVARTGFLNAVPLITGLCFMLISAAGLASLIEGLPPLERTLAWAGLLLSAWTSAISLRLLVVSRLYWHGIQPPTYRAYSGLMVGAWLAIVAFHITANLLTPKPLPIQASSEKPVILLGFDVPQDQIAAYETVMPAWQRHHLETGEHDITDFWAGLGTGTTAQFHRASLFRFKTPLFAESLSGKDPTQWIPLSLLNLCGFVRPLADGVRYQKYFWEILDEHGLATAAFAFWHSFPANSTHGGVLSERWSRDHDTWPYISGIKALTPRQRLKQSGPSLLRSAVQRENQSWAHLLESGEARPRLTVAYFPLGDFYELLPESDRLDAQQTLRDFRARMLQQLVETTDGKANVAIVITNGKRAARKGQLQATLFTNQFWAERLPTQFVNHHQIAPTLLNYFGLPAGRLMVPPLNDPPEHLVQRVDYGEHHRGTLPNEHLDVRYYDELRALGYIQ